MAGITLKELVEKLGAVGFDNNADIERIVRHYTSEGLLRTDGNSNTGRGKKRVYSEGETLYASVLIRLNRIGIPVGVLKKFMEALRKDLDVRRNTSFKELVRGMKKPCLICIIPFGYDESDTILSVVSERDNIANYFDQDLDFIVITLEKFRAYF